MNTIAKQKLFRYKPKYGVTEHKKAELDALTLEVLDAQQQVDQYQAIVTALTTKLNNFQALQNTAETNREGALNNKNLVDQVVQNFLDLQNTSGVAFNAMVNADLQTKKLAVTVRDVMNKLIFAAEVINKLGTQVVRKKALNPLVSDELVSMMTVAGNDANNAVALMLVALQSTYTAQASNMEAEAAFVLEYYESMEVYRFLSGTDETGQPARNPDGSLSEAYTGSLQQLLHLAYDNAKATYDQMYKATEATTKELSTAQMALSEAQGTLAALQAGLAAGNAAALAS